MFGKKNKKVEGPTMEWPEPKVEEVKVEDRVVPDKITAVTIIRDAVRDWVMPICNVPAQHKHDIDACLNYLLDEFEKPQPDIQIAEYLQKLIEEGRLDAYNRTYEDNGYEISLTIRKVK